MTQKETVFNAWIHPKEGGDDYEMEIKFNTGNKAQAEILLRKYLATKSIVVDDYKLLEKGA